MNLATPLRLGRINFVNVLPVHLHLASRPDLFREEPDVPSALNRRLWAGDLDLAEVSSVAYALQAGAYLILSGLCLCTRGPVSSVLLLSRLPLESWNGGEIEAPFESDTSVMLTRVLLARLWGLDCRMVPETAAGQGGEPVAVLRIGDRAIGEAASGRWPVVLDLGQVWQDWTGLPFVYALWVVRRTVARDRPAEVAALHQALLESRDRGLADLEGCARAAAAALGGDLGFYRRYFTQLRYRLGPEEQRGLRRFYDELAITGQLPHAPELDLFPTA
ncbi:MAG: menaquinone biosynthesis protein [Pseudomonadota bacterium]